MKNALAIPALLAVLAIGCGGDDDGNTDSEGSGGSGATAGTGGSGTGGSATGGSGGSGDCELSLTQYPGDCFALDPPDPSEGMQVRYGPPSYEPGDVERWLIQPGEETVDVQYAKATNTEEVYFSRYSGRLRPGSHHLIVSQSQQQVPDSLEENEEFPPLSFSTLFGSQTGNFDVPEPGAPVAPEEDGLAFKLGPMRQLSMNAHFINTTEDVLLREAWFNVWYRDPAEVKIVAAPIFLVAGVSMAVQPNSREIITGNAVAPRDLKVHLLFGHYHTHTVRFSAWMSNGGERTLVYEAYDYKEPPNMRYNSVITNPDPDPDAQTPGGYSGAIELSKGDLLEWECEIVNNDNFVIRFANEVITGEMCNLFGFYSPGDTGVWGEYN